MTLHGNALTSDEAAQLAAIRDRHEAVRGRIPSQYFQWKVNDTLLGWHDRLATLLAEREAEIANLKRVIDGNNFVYRAECEHNDELNAMVKEREAEIDRLRAELLKTPPTLEWLRAILGPEDNPVCEMTRWRKHDLVFVNGQVRHEWTGWLYRTRADLLAVVKGAEPVTGH